MTSVVFDPAAERAPRRKGRRELVSPRAPAPKPWAGALATTVASIGLVVTTLLVIGAESKGELSLPGGVATFLGNLTGMVGTYLALIMVLLASRLPLIERLLGQDGLLRWHRRVAPWPISLIVAHAVLLVVGYAQAAKTGVWKEIGTLVWSFPNVLAATVALGLMVTVGIVSLRAIRTRIRRETWWAIHLYLYLALALSFAHVILLGPSFVGHPLTQVVWSVVWAGTAGLVLTYRFAVPLARSLRHGLKVTEVRTEGPGVVSVICSGRHLEQLAVSGGQFFAWRFLSRGLWWQAHPYSLSARPRPPYLRLTVKQIGDHSRAVAQLRPGTRVMVEGPYGSFTADARRRGRVLLVAGGIGVTALRALLEDLPREAQPVVVVRATRQEDLVLRSELSELVRRRHGELHELVGRRDQVAFDENAMTELVPDLVDRDVFICGPPEFVQAARSLFLRAGVPRQAVHFEEFSW